MWNSSHANVLQQFVATIGEPPLDAEACRGWTRRVAEQFAFSFPGEGWGHKSAGSGRPPSTDVIATRAPFEGYDLILSQGTPAQSVIYSPGAIPLPGQVYIDVSPTNYIGSVVTPPPPTGDLEARVSKLERWARSF